MHEVTKTYCELREVNDRTDKCWSYWSWKNGHASSNASRERRWSDSCRCYVLIVRTAQRELILQPTNVLRRDFERGKFEGCGGRFGQNGPSTC